MKNATGIWHISLGQETLADVGWLMRSGVTSGHGRAPAINQRGNLLKTNIYFSFGAGEFFPGCALLDLLLESGYRNTKKFQ
jgi:hypothetical protein